MHDRPPSRDHLTNARPAPSQYKRQEKQSCKLPVFRAARVAKPANGKDLKSPQILASLSFRIVLIFRWLAVFTVAYADIRRQPLRSLEER